MDGVQYRSLEEIPDLEQVVELEIAIWQADPKEAVPSSIMHAHVATGGLVVGAFLEYQLIGLALAFPGWHGGKSVLWSHMTGVHSAYQRRGIGFGLKQFQRTWALGHGYETIMWTFDPLQVGNANFNLHRLGSRFNTYYVNFYGDMHDGINVGLPSDRVAVSWDLRDSRVKKLALGKGIRPDKSLINAQFVVTADADLRPLVDVALLRSCEKCLVEIPNNLSELKSSNLELALRWRLALREVMQRAFAEGYWAVDFVTMESHSYYVLAASVPWFLYVVECNDGTLYTGIALDVDQRLLAHNSGRGAAYTASRRPVRLLASWRFGNRGEVMRAEIALKRLARPVKLRLIALRDTYRGAPFVPFEV